MGINLAYSQLNREPGRFLPKPTLQGIGKIDTRIDNMDYWRKMADSGYVQVAPRDNVPAAIFTGSKIENPMVLTSNSTDIPVTSVVSTQSENSIFVSPLDDSLVLNSNNSTQNPVGGLYGADYLLTNDGGNTWGGSVTGAGGNNSGDPAATISLSGRMYIGFINSASGQSVSYSADGGVTWTPVVCGVYSGGLLDKNHLWIDNSAVSPYEGNVYSAWTDFGASGYPIKVTRSSDDGLTYSTPIIVSSAVNAGSHNQGVNIQTGPAGEVYVIWAIYDSWPSDEVAIGMAKSTNGGTSYAAASRIVDNIRGIRITETSKNQRVNSFPSMAVDISGGPRNGYIYIVWSNVGVPGVNTGSDIDVYMIRSIDGGTSWSAPTRINQDPTGQGNEHYFPWITCDPVTGDLSVIFYDDRNVGNNQCEVYCAVSYNGGDNWEDFKVSDVAFAPSPIPGLAGGYMGDYLGISARNNKVYPVWPDNRTGSVMTYCSPFDLSPLPGAAFIASTTAPCLNDTVIFTDMSNKNPNAWAWSFNPSTFSYVDGTSETSQDPHIRFEAFGDYNVQLIVQNSYGFDTLLKSNYISVNFANADFIADQTRPVINNPVTFTDQSSCNISSYSWNFGADASPATASTQGPHSVTYSATGFKTVSLTVNGDVTMTKTDYIEVLPESFNMSNGSLTRCTGIFYDPQGTNNYTNNQDVIMTIYPADTSNSIQLIFTLFDLESEQNCGYDYLKIYDGINTSAPLLGTWCGNNSPDTVVAYNSTGALTFRFHSDPSVVGQGWEASLACVETPPPVYCIASADICDEYISRVEFGSIDNVTICTTGGYHDYTNLSTKVSPGISYTISITNGNLNWPDDQCGIWIDWNHDMDFGDANETLVVNGSPGIGPYTASIVPPYSAVKGLTRLRARITYTGDVNPCGTTMYGEVEDYSIYVGTPGLWSGSTTGSTTDWNNPGNWDDGRVPPSDSSIVIPDEAPSYPLITGSRTCENLEIRDGGNLSVGSGATFNISGNLSVGEGISGAMIIDGGTCNVIGNITAQPGSNIDVKNGGALNDNN